MLDQLQDVEIIFLVAYCMVQLVEYEYEAVWASWFGYVTTLGQ